MRINPISVVLMVIAVWLILPVEGWAGLVSGPSARTQFEGFRASAGDTFVDFDSLAGTQLTTQISGVTFSSNIGTEGETPFGPYYVYVSLSGGRWGTIVGSPCDGCEDDGRVGYQMVFATPQRRAGLLRIWYADTRTRFYNQSGQLLADHPGTGFVGYIADGADAASQWVKRIQIDGVRDATFDTRQVGYSDDLFFGTAELPTISVPLVTGFNLTGNGFTGALNVLTTFGTNAVPVPGVSNNIEAVWAWNPTPPGKWQFHTPQIPDSAGYATENGYEVLTSVPAGAGYWISATAPFSLSAPAGTAFSYNSTTFAPLPSSFNLLSIGSTLTVQQFNTSVGAAQSNFNALWAWDASRTKWYFYSPTLEPTVVPTPPYTNAQYCAANGYQDFAGGTPVGVPALSLQPGVGFWVEKF